ncbi:MAG TPA: NAD(P)-binding domain-containing protein [Thermoanaerobaculia bacterium]|nr:NAD(P)-binding domain-containing protein [Thermoanaerobaculia bacterium]
MAPPPSTPEQEYEYLVLGAGPAGLQVGFYLSRAGRRYWILEAGDSAGTFFQVLPRKRTLISINKRYTGYDDRETNLRWDWNSLLSEGEGPWFTDYSERYFPSADRLVEYLRDFAERHALDIRYRTRVERVARDEEGFMLVDSEGGTYRAPRLIVATGVSKPYIPPIPGIELAEGYADAPADPEAYAGQHVLILGKGNSGFEMADQIIETAAVIHVASPESLKFAWRTHHVGHLRALNNNFLDTYQLKCQNAVLDATVERIERRDDGRFAVKVSYSHAGGEHENLVYDRVICCTGFRFDADLFDPGSRPALTIEDRFPAQTSCWESVNVPDLFFAGTLMQACDFKKTTSSFIHGFRYNIRTLHRLLEQRYHRRPLPYRTVEATVEGLTRAVLERVNRSSALWQQFGFLSDVIVVSDDGGARYYDELPTAYIPESDLGRAEHLYGVTLEFGPMQQDPFCIERKPDPTRADDSAFLHPVIQRYTRGEVTDRVHLLEDLYGEWRHPVQHVEPLRRFFAGQLEPRAVAVG